MGATSRFACTEHARTARKATCCKRGGAAAVLPAAGVLRRRRQVATHVNRRHSSTSTAAASPGPATPARSTFPPPSAVIKPTVAGSRLRTASVRVISSSTILLVVHLHHESSVPMDTAVLWVDAAVCSPASACARAGGSSGLAHAHETRVSTHGSLTRQQLRGDCQTQYTIKVGRRTFATAVFPTAVTNDSMTPSMVAYVRRA